MKRIMVFTVIAVCFCLFGNVSAEDDGNLKQGCQKFQNPESLLKKGWIVKDEDLRGMDRLGYCKGRSELLTMKYGNAQSLMVNNRFGIGQNITYSYQTFCNTLGELHWRLAGDRQGIQKLIILIFSPVFVENPGGVTHVPSLLKVMFPIDIDPLNLFQVDIELFGKQGLKDIKITNNYKAFYTALFTGNTERAEQLVREVPDEFINIVNGVCR